MTAWSSSSFVTAQAAIIGTSGVAVDVVDHERAEPTAWLDTFHVV